MPIDYSLESTFEDWSITTDEGRTEAFGQYDHVRWYGKDYPQKLSSNGFNVKEDDFVKTFSEDELYRYGLMSSEFIYYCLK